MMEILRGFFADFHPHFWASVVEIIWINILLSGDNALVIALACRALPFAARVPKAAGWVLNAAIGGSSGAERSRSLTQVTMRGSELSQLLLPTWSGVYAGFQAGGAWGDTGWSFPFAEPFNSIPGQRFSVNPGGGLAGGQLGINWQFGGILLGGELAFVGTDWNR